MGVTIKQDFIAAVQQLHYSVKEVALEPFSIVSIKDNVYINLIGLNTQFQPHQLISLQTIYAQKGIMLVHLWEDVWLQRRYQVLSRIQSFCGLNNTLYARKAKIEVLDSAVARDFLEVNHLQGFIKTKYNYGLIIDHTLVAVACFSATRPMRSKGNHYNSAELIRFATLAGFTVVGGLSKLIVHFTNQVDTNDLMTYADRDWSLGKGYDQLKFQQTGVVAPVFFYFDMASLKRYAIHRMPKNILLAFNEQKTLNLDDFLIQNGFRKIFNTGSLKYHLYT